MAHETDDPKKGEVKFKNGRAYYDGDPWGEDDEDAEDDAEE
jgi:hypothetical protein